MSGLFPFVPAFLDLAGKPAVLLSGEASLAPLARTLLEAGAGVLVFDAEPSAEMTALNARIVPRRWRPPDLQRAAFVVAGAGERRPARARLAAKSARALFYMEGAPEWSDVSFGANVRQGAVSIGVAAAGLSPAVGETLARRIETFVPPHYAGFLAAAASEGPVIALRIPDAAAREAFWREAAGAAFEANPPDWAAWLGRRLPPLEASS